MPTETITILPPLPDRPAAGHKGTFGRVLVVGGNAEMIGAPVLAGTAALTLGAGLVQIAVPMSILPSAISITPELIGLGLGTRAAETRLIDACEKAGAIVLGPGLGPSADAKARVMRLIRLKKPMVIDADGLNHLAAQKAWPKSFAASAVLTPHPGEMARLGKLLGVKQVPDDDQGRVDLAIRASEKFGQLVVLKGHRTVVTDARRVYVNRSGDSSLSKAGTGDVLSGMIGTLLAQKMDPFDAACAAVYLHGRAGEIAGAEHGSRSVLARDIIDTLPRAIKEYESR